MEARLKTRTRAQNLPDAHASGCIPSRRKVAPRLAQLTPPVPLCSVFEEAGAKVIVDEGSLALLKGAARKCRQGALDSCGTGSLHFLPALRPPCADSATVRHRSTLAWG